MDLLERIKKALRIAGMEELPSDTSEPLAAYGMDSLLMVLGVAALEKELSLRISGRDFSEQAFHSLDSLTAWLRKLGAT
ncbi:acyl carrier protein [Myxococcus sp. CA051A]|uniref:Acyl carrier protein n=1 Tax=Myxococcus llanfairpwllgwyngyllgogerychwyrndrobwllllantysiliogogogochensis TaxID=2590453 RepID=A0A540X6J2_9BACT|nr:MULTISPECIES: acyl carrier protein [Myxococcus]NTX16077.1 acyl carrier protein [Myxococcus sp. CA056]NTX41611.1 acyl carrier protein [Myxococcus sp. CA033]NTX65846.1 acyl carrier protein [Myxococcus sp. CA051A]TQF16812.1 acyl carrier protein [Myxococcus llanfairpwllgwyngyllgogerychwyrndrobwllllantysiliogogogochensis]